MDKPPLMRRLFLAGSSIAAIELSVPARARAAPSEPMTALWQGLELLDANGTIFRVGDARASLTLVKLWANWCSVCLSEMASLKSLTTEMGPRDIEVILISHPEYWARDQQVARSRGMPFRLATPSADNGPSVIQAALLEQNGTYAVPRSLLFKKAQDAAIWKRRGAKEWASPHVMAELRSQLG